MWTVCKLPLALFAQLGVLLFFASGCSGFLNDVAINQATQSYSATISGLSLGAIPGGTASAPPLTISTATGDVSTLQARIVDLSGTALSSWATFASTNAVSGLTLNNYTRYKYEVRALYPTGLASTTVSSGYWIPESDDCKEGRITDSPYANSSDSPTGANLANAIDICTADQLQEIAGDTANYGKYFTINAGLNMNDISGSFTPIGTVAAPFYGTFNGLTRSIRNLYISTPTTDYVGLFGYTGGAALTILDLSLVAVNITGQQRSGALIGFANSGAFDTLITNVSSSGTVAGTLYVGGLIGQIIATVTSLCTNCSSSAAATASAQYVGGLAGVSSTFNYVDSFATGNTSGTFFIGGLIGMAIITQLTDTYATGNVSATANMVGGLVGQVSISCAFTRVFATGSVSSAGNQVGGLIGASNTVTDFQLTNAYATGDVTGNSYVGGLNGYSFTVSGIYRNLYATGDVTGGDVVGGLFGSLGNWGGGAVFDLENSFATGTVSGNSPTNNVSLLAGQFQGGVTAVNSHYASNVSCVNTSGVCTAVGTGHDLSITPNYFFLSTNAPLTSWNFATIWQTVVTNFPTLQ